MKTNKLLLFVLIAFQTAIAQRQELTVRDLTPKHQENTFPVVSNPANPRVAENINTFLQLSYLEQLPGTFKKHPFENVATDRSTRFEDSHSTIEFFRWEKKTTPVNVLSLSIECEYTGAYSEDDIIYKNFDTRTGHLITLSSLIKKEQLKTFTKLLNDNVKQRVTDFLSTVTKELTTLDSIKDQEEFVRHSEQLVMYNSCIEDNDEYELEYYNFYFLKDSLHIIRERCSDHVNRAIDDLYEIEMSFSFGEMNPYFSAYAISLINNSSDIKSENPEGKIFKGKIGNLAISAYIKEINADGSLDMVYWYDKYKIPIEWNGTFTDNHFSLTERNDDNEYSIVAKIEADWSNPKITGTWTNSKTKQALKLELTAY